MNLNRKDIESLTDESIEKESIWLEFLKRKTNFSEDNQIWTVLNEGFQILSSIGNININNQYHKVFYVPLIAFTNAPKYLYYHKVLMKQQNIKHCLLLIGTPDNPLYISYHYTSKKYNSVINVDDIEESVLKNIDG